MSISKKKGSSIQKKRASCPIFSHTINLDFDSEDKEDYDFITSFFNGWCSHLDKRFTFV